MGKDYISMANRERLIVSLALDLIDDEPGNDRYWLDLPTAPLSARHLAARLLLKGIELVSMEPRERGVTRIYFTGRSEEVQ